MKKLLEFSSEETAEEWLRELYKVVAMRRSSMFRLITESVRLVLFGNGGGAALVIGFMSASNVDATPAYHWLALGTLLVFGVGTLASALAMILVTVVSIKEAHSAETALKGFVDGNIHRDQVMFTVEEQTFRIADAATFAGVFAAIAFGLGGGRALMLLMLFF